MVQVHLVKKEGKCHILIESQHLMPYAVNVTLSISPPVMTVPCGLMLYSALLISCSEHLATGLSDLTACWPLCVGDGSSTPVFFWQCHCHSVCRYSR